MHQAAGRETGRLAGALYCVLRAPGEILRELLVLVVNLYRRVISPLLPASCRFTPSCSTYAVECLRRYGLGKALLKTTWRLVRCNPYCHGGHDPP